MKAKPLRLRPPLVTFERAKISLLIVVYAALAEYVDPRPFANTTLARVLYAVLVLEVVRQWSVWRLEESLPAAARARSARARWDRLRGRVEPWARYRMRRAVLGLIGLWGIGFMLDALTTRCEGAAQCILLAPRIAVENLPQALQVALYIAIGMAQLFIMMWSLTKVGFVKIVMPGTIDVRWEDVYGQDRARDRVREQVELLENSADVEAAGGYMPKGLLLYGPPGSGKTMLAQAAAAASTKPLIMVPPGGFASTFVGVNFLKVWSLFRLIRKRAVRHGGVIVFLDEIDSLGSRGGQLDGAEREVRCDGSVLVTGTTHDHASYIDGGGGLNQGTLQAFLAAMDGMKEPRGVINKVLAGLGFRPLPPPEYKWLLIGATNRREALDPALRRAGRIGLEVKVGYPGPPDRLATYRGYLGKVKHEVTDGQLEWAAANHHRGTGAEIKDIVNEALLRTFRDGREEAGVIRFADLMEAMTRVKFGEPEEPFDSETGLWAVSVHEAGHAVAVHHTMRERQRIWFATVRRHGGTGGMVVRTPLSEDWVESRTDVEAGIVVSLASRVAEDLILGEPTNGHGGDGRSATEQAERMVKYGHTFDRASGEGQIGTYDGDRPAYRLLLEQVLWRAHARAYAVLEGRTAQVEAIANLLRDNGTVDGATVHDVLDKMERGES